MLDPPIFPKRNIYTVGETGDAALKALLRWVQGSTFHKYGTTMTPSPYTYQVRGQLLVFRSWINHHGGLSWSVSFGREGEERGLCSGGSCPEDVAYSACSMIEEHEREAYEEALAMVGLS